MIKKESDEKRLMRWLRNEVYKHSQDVGKVNRWFATPKYYLKGHTPNQIIHMFGIAQLVQTINTPRGQANLSEDFLSTFRPDGFEGVATFSGITGKFKARIKYDDK